MKNERLLAYALIGLGAITLLARSGGADWLWIALLGVAFLFGHVSRKRYGFLIAGCVLMGVAVGTLIGSQGGMLLSLAAGFFAIDQIETRSNRWPLYTAGILAVLGGFSALSALGILSSVWFAALLIGGGLYLLYRERGRGRFPPQAGTESPYVPPAAPHTPTTSASPPAPADDVDDVVAPTASAIPVAEADTVTRPASRASPPPVTNSPPTPEREVPAEAQTRLARLEGWRRDTASAAGTPAYIIFSNDTLFRIAVGNPQTLDELDRVRGVGPVKLSRYGDAVLALLRGETVPTEGGSS